MGNWKSDLELTVRQANAQVFGAKLIEHVYHAALVRVAIVAFGDDPRATFFIEGQAPIGDIPRPDLIILHPEIGVLVIENKGVELGDIHNVHNSSLTLIRDGRLKEEDPFKQAEKVMYRLRDLCSQRFDLRDALFLRTAALPRIRRAEFELKFKTQWLPETLFADAVSDARSFRKQVLAYSDAGQRTARKTHKLTKRTHNDIMTILSGKGLFYSPRRTHIDATDQNLLGVHIQEMELAFKDATEQQKEFGKADLRGAHRLFRGVAGSGKSIMVALSVAQSLVNFNEESSTLFGKQPPRRILVVCFNKTLVHYLRSKIEGQYGRIAWDAPSDEMLIISHFEGIVRDIESTHASLVTGLNYEQKEERAKALSAAFDKLDATTKESLLVDAIYVDEAQDLIPAEFELLLRLARRDKDGKQTIIIFYDNAQNIYGVTPPTWEKLGINIVGRTIFLDQCLLNTTQTLAFTGECLFRHMHPTCTEYLDEVRG